MKLGKNRIHLLIMLFAVLSLLVHVPSDVFANDGGNIVKILESEHSPGDRGTYNSLVQVDSDTYALAYAGGGPDFVGYISTFDIDSAGNITPILIENHAAIGGAANFEHDAAQAIHNSLVQVDSNTYALAYTGADGDGFITSFTISSDGSSITEVAGAILEHDDGDGQYNSLVQVDSDTYALAYAGNNADGYISTFDIDSDGDITPILIENHAAKGGSANLEHDIDRGQYNSLVQVDSDTYALAYAGDDKNGTISTFTISSDGSSIDEVSSFLHDTPRGIHSSIVQVDSDTYALAYASDSRIGYISTFTISATVTTSSGEEKKSGSECIDCTAPSLGISKNHKDPVRVIDDGITFNEESFDVREFAKIYDTIDTKTGVTNTIQLKIYEDSKPENVRKAILYLGLDSSDIYRNLACIIWENNSYGEKTITIIDKFDLFEDESATATIDGDILFLNYTFTSKIPIPTSTIAVELRDDKYNFGLNYFENVIKVSGNPLQGTGTF